MSKEDSKDKDDMDNEAEENKVKWDSIYLKVYDGDRLIRSLKQKTPKETGVHRMRWFMDEAGVSRPSRTIRKQNNEPSGVSVKPGNYKLIMHYGNQTSEEMITVKSDPRLQVSTASINQVYDASKKLENMNKVTADAVKQLVESKGVAEKYKKELDKLDKKKYKEQVKLSKDIIKKIDEVIALYLGKVDKRQGITRNPEVNVVRRLGLARRYVGSRKSGITSTETTLTKHAKDALNEALDKTNTFFKDEWKTYESAMKQLDISPFKDLKTFKID